MLYMYTVGIPCQHFKYCTDNKSHNEWYVLDGIDLHSSCIWIQTEVVREVEAKETAKVEHLYILSNHKLVVNATFTVRAALPNSLTNNTIPQNSCIQIC